MTSEIGSRRPRLRAVALTLLLVVSLTLSVFAVRHAPEPIVDWLLETELRQQSQLWRNRVLQQIQDPGARFDAQQLSSAEATNLSRFPQAADFFRFSLLNRDGVIFWSSHSEHIGDVDAARQIQSTLTEGELVLVHLQSETEISEGHAQHGHSHDDADHQIVYEIYVPITQDGRYLGAVKFHSDVTALHEGLEKNISNWLFLGSCIILLLMTLVVGTIIVSSRRQMRRLHIRAREERDILENQVRLAREVRLLGDLNEWLQSSRSLSELFDMVARFMKHILPESEGALYVYSNSRDVLDGATSWNGGTHHDHIHPESCWGLRRGRVYQFGQNEVEFTCEHTEPHDGRPYFCMPIQALGETIGLMHLKKRAEADQTDFEKSRRLAQMCAEQISMALANVRMRDELEDRSIRDPLTGLFNRRHMMDSMRKLIARADAKAARIHAVYIDVDHFKAFNDTHGHDAGDMVLRAVGELLIQNCDGDEVPCRMGGEEFMLLLPELPQEVLKQRIETLRRDVAALSVRYGEKTLPKITISAGIASYPEHGLLPQDLLCAADKALYEAKDGGRNMVVMAQAGVDNDTATGSTNGRKPPHGLAAE